MSKLISLSLLMAAVMRKALFFAKQVLGSGGPSMTKRHCFVTQVGDAIEALATALDPERKPPFRGDILDLLEWAAKDVLAMRQQVAELTLSSDTYFTERNSARDAWRRVSKERDQLRQQLAAVSDLLKKASGPMSYGNWSSEFRHSVEKALAITPSISEWQKLVAENAELRQQFAAANTLINKYREETTSLRQQVTLLRDAMKAAWRDGYAFCGAEGLSEAQKQFQAALTTTEPI